MIQATVNHNHKQAQPKFSARALVLLALLALLVLPLSSCTKAVFESVENAKYSLTPQDPIAVVHGKGSSTEAQRLEIRVKNQMYRQGFNVVEDPSKAKYEMRVELHEARSTVTETSGSGSGVAFGIPISNSISLAVPITSSRGTSETSQSVSSRTLYLKVYSVASNEPAWSGSATYYVGQPAPYYNSIINTLLNSYGESYYGKIKIKK